MHGLNVELGRHRGREGKVECTLCGAQCKRVIHVLWECLAYSSMLWIDVFGNASGASVIPYVCERF